MTYDSTTTIGIDIGGTNIKAAKVEDNKIIGNLVVRETPNDLGGLAQVLVNIIQELGGGKATKIGIAIPGLIDMENKKMICSPNLQFLDGMNLYEILPEYHAMYGNDADMALLGEVTINKLENKNILLLTLGTGIGSAFNVKGVGSWDIGYAGEFGHMKAVPDGKQCSCGGWGCVEAYFSGHAIISDAKEAGLAANDAKQVFELATGGNDAAMKIVEKASTILGLGIANVVNLLGINKVIFSGKISKSYDVFIPFVKTVLERNVFAYQSRVVKLMNSDQIDKSAIIGAAKFSSTGKP